MLLGLRSGLGFFHFLGIQSALRRKRFYSSTDIIEDGFVLDKINTGDITVSIGRPFGHFANHISNSCNGNTDFVLLLPFRFGEWDSVGGIFLAGADGNLFALLINQNLDVGCKVRSDG